MPLTQRGFYVGCRVLGFRGAFVARDDWPCCVVVGVYTIAQVAVVNVTLYFTFWDWLLICAPAFVVGVVLSIRIERAGGRP